MSDKIRECVLLIEDEFDILKNDVYSFSPKTFQGTSFQGSKLSVKKVVSESSLGPKINKINFLLCIDDNTYSFASISNCINFIRRRINRNRIESDVFTNF
jgi:hypothetical protein